MPKKTMAEKNVKILGIVISAFLIICSLSFVGNILYEIYSFTVVNNIIYYVVEIVAQGMLLTAFILLAVSILSKNKLKIDIIKIFAELFLIANILYLSNGLYQLVVIFGADILSVFGTVFGLVNICIVEKITKFDNDIFLDFRAAGKSFAGSTIRLRMACP